MEGGSEENHLRSRLEAARCTHSLPRPTLNSKGRGATNKRPRTNCPLSGLAKVHLCRKEKKKKGAGKVGGVKRGERTPTQLRGAGPFCGQVGAKGPHVPLQGRNSDFERDKICAKVLRLLGTGQVE